MLVMKVHKGKDRYKGKDRELLCYSEYRLKRSFGTSEGEVSLKRSHRIREDYGVRGRSTVRVRGWVQRTVRREISPLDRYVMFGSGELGVS